MKYRLHTIEVGVVIRSSLHHSALTTTPGGIKGSVTLAKLTQLSPHEKFLRKFYGWIFCNVLGFNVGIL